MAATHALTRAGQPVNRAGRPGVSAAMRRLLTEGARYADPDSVFAPEELRAWTARLRQLSIDLADCVEAPARNRVMEVLESDSVDDSWNALYILRMNVAGASPEQLGDEAGVAGRTIERLEQGLNSRVDVAKKLADQFSLSVLELFRHQQRPTGRDSLVVRTVGELRAALLTPGDEHGIRRLADGLA